jgi:UDP-glucose 4-epimerase
LYLFYRFLIFFSHLQAELNASSRDSSAFHPKILLALEVFNLGTGRGNTVLEVIKTFEKISGLTLNYEISPRRKGDIIKAYADTTKANKVLGWKAGLSLEEALISAWRWEKKIRNL